MKITPIEIQQHQFNVRFRGFDIREVDAFLEQMGEAYQAQMDECEALKDELRRVKLECQGYRDREETIRQAMTGSQKVMEQVRENARKSAELILHEAELKSQKILQKAHGRLAQLNEDISEMKRQRMQIELQIRSVLEAHTKLLDMSKEELKTMEEEESKLKFLKQSKPSK